MNWGDEDGDGINDVSLLVREAAILTHRTRKTIYEWINAGLLSRSIDARGRVRVSTVEVLRVEARMGYNGRKAS